jgi:hypothetical protein
LQASKWRHVQVLLDAEEMRDLCAFVAPMEMYNASEVAGADFGKIALTAFLNAYEDYVRALREGRLPDMRSCRRSFSMFWTRTPELLYAQRVGEGRYLVRALRPVVQVQAHHFLASAMDGKLYPMTLSRDSVTWGVQFAYPQLFQHPKAHTFERVADSSDFPNTGLFLALVRWMRQRTVPTPFLFLGKAARVPMRIGKQALEWIARHPQLGRDLEVVHGC